MEIRQEGVRLKHRWQELTEFSSFAPPQIYAAHSCSVPWKAIPATAADDKEIIIMRFYLQGYAEVLHLATTSRCLPPLPAGRRSEEHTSELQSLMRISYAVFCLKKKITKTT